MEYTKESVYELIAEKEMQLLAFLDLHRGARGGNYSNKRNFNHSHINNDGMEILFPRAGVVDVIGKGKDLIKKIQAETGTRVQFQQGREDGLKDRKCFLSGKHKAMEQACQRIQELIESVMRTDDDRNNIGARIGPRGPFGTGKNSSEWYLR